VTVAATAQTETVKARLRGKQPKQHCAPASSVCRRCWRGASCRRSFFGASTTWIFLDRFLAGNDPLGAEKSAFADWFNVKPSARRQT